VNLQSRDEQQVEHTERLVGLMGDDTASALRVGEKLVVRSEEVPAVCQVDGKRAEGPSLVQLAQLLNRHWGHGSKLRASRGPWLKVLCVRKAMQSINSLSQWNLRLWVDASGTAAVVTLV
jgi:hypothetical protein